MSNKTYQKCLRKHWGSFFVLDLEPKTGVDLLDSLRYFSELLSFEKNKYYSEREDFLLMTGVKQPTCYSDLSLLGYTNIFKKIIKNTFDKISLQPYSKIDRTDDSFRRFDVKISHSFVNSNVFSNTFSLYYAMVPKDIKPYLDALFNLVKHMSEFEIFSVFKNIGNDMKIYSEFDPEVRYFLTELGGLSGYMVPDRSAIDMKQCEAFIVSDILPYSDFFTTKAHIDLFSSCATDFFSENIRQPNLEVVEDLGLFDYISDVGRWAVSGASNWEKTKDLRNKWGTALKMDTNAIISRLYDRRYKCVNRANWKEEAGKLGRVTFSGDMKQYLLMSFIMDKLHFVPTGQTTLFEDAKSEKERLEMFFNYMDSGKVSFPLDMNEFDKYPSKEMILLLINIMRKYCFTKHTGDINDAFDLLIDSLENETYLDINGQQYKWLRGILSGWKMTALLGTIISNVYFRMADSIVENTTGLTSCMFSTQGDDTTNVLQSYYHAYLIYATYKILKIKLSDGKFYMSRLRTEFLRKEYKNRKVSGYPARLVTKILYRSTEQPKTNPGLERYEEGLSNWREAKSRGLNISNFYRNDLIGRLGFYDEQLFKTGYLYGGANLLNEYQNDGKILSINQSDVSVSTFDDSVLLGYNWSKITRLWKTGIDERLLYDSLKPQVKEKKYYISAENVDSLSGKYMNMNVDWGTGSPYGTIPVYKKNIPMSFRGVYFTEKFNEAKTSAEINIVLNQFFEQEYVSKLLILKNRMSKALFKDYILGGVSVRQLSEKSVYFRNVFSRTLVNSIFKVQRLNQNSIKTLGLLACIKMVNNKRFFNYSVK